MESKLNKKVCRAERSRSPWNKVFIRTSTSLGLTALMWLLLSACQKKIEVNIPDYVQKLVVEGKVEVGANPEVYLSYSVPYFGNHTSSLADFAVKNAIVVVNDGTTTDTLKDATLGGGFYYKANTMIGAVGKTYQLSILLNGETYTAQTTIYPQVKLDSLWFKVLKDDSLGFVYTHMTEPAGTGNSYRWFGKRINKDQSFIAPLGSAFDDKFIDGKSFEFAYNRGVMQNSHANDYNKKERSYFKRGDKVIIKFCSIGYDEFRFFRSYDANIISNGNPFAAPTNLENNVHGKDVIGVWCGYNPFIDTLICQ